MHLFPYALFVAHRGQDNGRGPSPRLWSRAQGQLFSADGFLRGTLLGSDFKAFGASAAVASNVGRYGDEGGQYLSYEDTGDAIAQVATVKTIGQITFTSAATDNNESWLQPGGTGSVSNLISDTAGDDKKLIFECRVKVGQLAETAAFWGLTEESLAAANTLVDDTGALASKDMIGFHVPAHATLANVDFTYRKAGQTAQVVIDDLAVLVADTYVKFGFIYDPTAPTANRIAIFKDGVEQSTYVTGTNIAAATFPDGEELQPLFGQKVGAAAAKTSSIDWWYCWQEDA